MGQIRL